MAMISEDVLGESGSVIVRDDAKQIVGFLLTPAAFRHLRDRPHTDVSAKELNEANAWLDELLSGGP